jgi:Xaa-Pro aminopeptidase
LQSAKEVKPSSIILVDCGGQYKFGTTDMTRMIFLQPKNLSLEFKICYTAVIKAHIQLACTEFIEGTKGSCLDFIARREIFKIQQNYNHGTGHGVGFCLNVHEYPNISPLSENIIKEGQVVSIEPGIYIENKFGIRIENLYYVEKIKNKNFQDKLFLEKFIVQTKIYGMSGR